MEIMYRDVEKVVNYYFDKKEAAWRVRKNVPPISRNELMEQFGFTDEYVIEIQKYLRSFTSTPPIIVLDKGGCVLGLGVDKRKTILNAIYSDLVPDSGTKTTTSPYEDAPFAETTGDIIA